MWASLKSQMKTPRLDFHRSKISYQDNEKASAGITPVEAFVLSGMLRSDRLVSRCHHVVPVTKRMTRNNLMSE